MAGLPGDFPAALVAVVHTAPYGSGALAQILDRAGILPAVTARDGDHLRGGTIYVAPPDRHVFVRDGHLQLSRGPRENGFRPSIDVLFRSAARAGRSRVIGVVLTGALDDGTAGLFAIKRLGGLAVVQDPDDAAFDAMPRNALAYVDADAVVRLDALGETLLRLTNLPAEEPVTAVPEELDYELRVLEADMGAIDANEKPGTPSPFTCPECHGTLWQIHDGDLTRYRCRVGHGYSNLTLLTHQDDSVEAALWTALKALEERSALCNRLERQAVVGGRELTARQFRQQADEAERKAATLRNILIEPADDEAAAQTEA